MVRFFVGAYGKTVSIHRAHPKTRQARQHLRAEIGQLAQIVDEGQPGAAYPSGDAVGRADAAAIRFVLLRLRQLARRYSGRVVDRLGRQIFARFHDVVRRYSDARRSHVGTFDTRADNDRLRPKSGRRTDDSRSDRDTDKPTHTKLPPVTSSYHR